METQYLDQEAQYEQERLNDELREAKAHIRAFVVAGEGDE